ncbi:hypothetical protein QJQ45_029954 [Haematococcus lacustris]|nr:hypothetical protein QJQ45_029954 [Haematococcus lacustris]
MKSLQAPGGGLKSSHGIKHRFALQENRCSSRVRVADPSFLSELSDNIRMQLGSASQLPPHFGTKAVLQTLQTLQSIATGSYALHKDVAFAQSLVESVRGALQSGSDSGLQASASLASSLAALLDLGEQARPQLLWPTLGTELMAEAPQQLNQLQAVQPHWGTTAAEATTAWVSQHLRDWAGYAMGSAAVPASVDNSAAVLVEHQQEAVRLAMSDALSLFGVAAALDPTTAGASVADALARLQAAVADPSTAAAVSNALAGLQSAAGAAAGKAQDPATVAALQGAITGLQNAAGAAAGKAASVAQDPATAAAVQDALAKLQAVAGTAAGKAASVAQDPATAAAVQDALAKLQAVAGTAAGKAASVAQDPATAAAVQDALAKLQAVAGTAAGKAASVAQDPATAAAVQDALAKLQAVAGTAAGKAALVAQDPNTAAAFDSALARLQSLASAAAGQVSPSAWSADTVAALGDAVSKLQAAAAQPATAAAANAALAKLGAAAGGAVPVADSAAGPANAMFMTQLLSKLQAAAINVDPASLTAGDVARDLCAGNLSLGNSQMVSMALPALAQAVEGGLQVLAQAGGVGPALAADAHQAGSTGLDGATGASQWWPGNVDVGTLAVLAASLFGLVSVPSSPDPAPGVEGKELELDYEWSAAAAEAYWSRRPVAVAQRAMEVARECAGLGLALLADQATGRLAANEEQRAMQLRTCIERLGPAYVKVAQALSTRVDLLSPAYFQQIQLLQVDAGPGPSGRPWSLQDRVAPFPCEEARAVMTASFGKPVEQVRVFAKLSEKPVAAASLGQVYRATLLPELGGTEVAVKVQRPGVLAAVSLDLMLIRRAMALLQPQVNSDLAGLVDAWAERFLHEMDYRREAASALRFARDMEQLQGVTVAEPLPALTTDQVLTSVWLAGERLGESSAPDVRTLCTTLLNAYLIQLLDTGFLHADPHPGNLLRTPEGRIAILDFGLMTEVSEDQRWALMEYIAHLATSNWVEVAKDLQRLGFIAPGVDASEVGLVEPLGLIMGQLVSGGGAAKVNIDKVVGELEALGKLYPIQVPPFFALIVRAFSVIEGIALGVDPDYAIVMECFPYLTRRLLSDDSPRARAILRDILYGNRSRLDVERLNMMADGIAAYNTDGLLPQQDTRDSGSMVSVQAAGASSSTLRGALLTPSTSAPLVPVKPRTATPSQLQSPASNQQPIIHPQALEALSIVFSKRGSYVQELLVAEAVAAVDALSKEASAQLLRAFLRSGPAMITRQTEALLLSPLLALGSRLGSPSNTLLALLPPSPLEFLDRLTPIVALTPEDREALAVLQGIAALLRKASSVTLQPATATPGLSTGRHFMTTRNVATLSQVSQELRPMMPELMPGIMHMAELFVQAMLVRLRARMGSVVALAQQPHFSTAVYSSNGQARENASR